MTKLIQTNVGQMMSVTVAVLLLSACASKPTPPAKTATTRPSVNYAQIPQRYQVKSGDTVAKIASRYGLNWREISHMNRLDANHTIRVGQWLTLHQGAGNHAKTVQTQPPAQKSSQSQVQSQTAKNPMIGSVGVMQFGYPVGKSNQVVRHFGEVNTINGTAMKAEGMWFMGQSGDLISASGAGEVILVDNTNTGTMVGILHDDGFISHYLHVGDVKVKKGQRINKGERIASMKPQSNGAVLMEFRIIRGGVYIDPVMVLK